jgi:hypothetical protein
MAGFEVDITGATLSAILFRRPLIEGRHDEQCRRLAQWLLLQGRVVEPRARIFKAGNKEAMMLRIVVKDAIGCGYVYLQGVECSGRRSGAEAPLVCEPLSGP